MRVTCSACGLGFDAKSPQARYCSARCRQRGSRAGRASVSQIMAPKPSGVDGPLTAATRQALVSAGREGSPHGIAALLLAQRLDHPTGDTGSAVASMVREHRATLEQATRGVALVGDPLDELRARRDAKRNAG